jgi:hypothetical protein
MFKTQIINVNWISIIKYSESFLYAGVITKMDIKISRKGTPYFKRESNDFKNGLLDNQ